MCTEKAVFSQMFNGLRDYIIITPVKGNICFANNAFCSFYGCTNDELLQKDVYEIFEIAPKHEYSSPNFENIDDDVAFERVFVTTLKGGKLEGELFTRNFSYNNGNFSLNIFRTLLQRHQNAFDETDTYLTLAELSDNPVFVHDGVSILFANSAFHEFFGVGNDVKFADIMKMADPVSQAVVRDALAKRLINSPDAPSRYEISITVHGQIKNIVIAAKRISYFGKVAVLVNATDITDYKNITQRVVFLNTILKAIGQVNQLMVRERNIEIVLKNTSEILGEIPHYALVYPYVFGYKVEFSPKAVREFGAAIKFIDDFAVSLFDKIVDAGAFFTNNFAQCTDFEEQFVSTAVASGVFAFAAVPMANADQIYGFFAVCVSVEHNWEDDEKALLREISEDLAFAVYAANLEEEKHVVEKRLEYGEKLYWSLVDHAPLGIFFHNGKHVLMANKSLANSLGYANCDEISAIDISKLLPDDARKNIDESFADPQMKTITADIDILDAHNIRLPFFVAISRNSTDDETLYTIMAKDNSAARKVEREKKLLEERLLQLQKLEAIGRLSGGIAHDFNNVLNVIIANAEGIKSNVSVSSPAYKMSELVLRAAFDAAKLTQKILRFSRRTPIERVAFGVNAAVGEVLELIKSIAPKNVDFIFQASYPEPVAFGDMAQIEQALLNIFVNAVDAMPDGGKVFVKLAVGTPEDFALPLLRNGIFVRIDISDTGVGMSEETRAKIFDPFFTTKPTGKSTGLGLTMTYSTILEHEGHISVDSVLGGGTTFSLFIPTTDEAVAPENLRITGRDKHKTETILVADDELVVLNLLVDLLQSRGYRVLPATDGIEAYTLFREKRSEIDIILLDVVMPKLDGIETLKKIIALDPSAKVLMLSGYTHIETMDECLRLGAISFVKKPFRIAELSQKIWEVLRQ